ncbi:MAG: hypothetical protein SCM11_00955 [Bacillota bacterium]|nr:hypothetical protein [Bacillota bacterium]
MKKYALPALLALLVILQILSLSRISSLKNNLQNTQNQLSSLISSQSGQISSLYSRIENLLNQQDSLIEGFDYSFGMLDQETLTIPVTFTVIPKEVKTGARAILHVSGQSTEMIRNGPAYSATLQVNIFELFQAMFVLVADGTEKTETLAVVSNLRSRVLPDVDAHFEGMGKTGYHRDQNATSGTYTWDGQIFMQFKPTSETNTIENARYVVDLDGTILSENPIDTQGQYQAIKETFAFTAGQALTLSVLATDSYGLIHQVVLERVRLDNNMEPIHDEWPFMEIIMKESGEVVFKS